MKKLKYVIPLTLIFAFSVLSLQGCTTSHKSKTVTSVESSGNKAVDTTATDTGIDDETASTTKKTVEEKETTHEKVGLLGSTLEFVGEVLAFPFKLIANVIEFIF